MPIHWDKAGKAGIPQSPSSQRHWWESCHRGNLSPLQREQQKEARSPQCKRGRFRSACSEALSKQVFLWLLAPPVGSAWAPPRSLRRPRGGVLLHAGAGGRHLNATPPAGPACPRRGPTWLELRSWAPAPEQPARGELCAATPGPEPLPAALRSRDRKSWRGRPPPSRAERSSPRRGALGPPAPGACGGGSCWVLQYQSCDPRVPLPAAARTHSCSSLPFPERTRHWGGARWAGEDGAGEAHGDFGQRERRLRNNNKKIRRLPGWRNWSWQQQVRGWQGTPAHQSAPPVPTAATAGWVGKEVMGGVQEVGVGAQKGAVGSGGEPVWLGSVRMKPLPTVRRDYSTSRMCQHPSCWDIHFFFFFPQNRP